MPDVDEIDDWMSIEENSAFRDKRGAGLVPTRAVATTYRRTSGSLGAPKLVAMPFAHEMANARSIVRTLGFRREDRLALPVPIFHTFGAEMLLGAVSIGMSVDLQPRSNVIKLLEREAEWRPTVAVLSPLHCEWLARTRRRPRPYRLTITGGDRIARSTAERYEALHGPLLIAYGSTETGGVAYSRIADSPDLRLSSVIHPRPGIAVRVEHSSEAIEGSEAGVLWVRNPHAFVGYVDMNGNALPHFASPDGSWYRTGDVAVLNDEGLQVLGRWDLSINRDGLLLPLADVESQARQIPEVSEAVAVAGTYTPRGRELVLFCTVPAGQGAVSADIRKACAERLPNYAVPDTVRIIEEMPRLPAGKPDRRALAGLLTT
jgi:acyl-CoA synthetase (AMP-forming)/AMP-acid ligase II